MFRRYLCVLLGLCLIAVTPAWSAAEAEAEWQGRIDSIRALDDEASAQQATTELARTLPAQRSVDLEYQWLSLQMEVAARHSDGDSMGRLANALLALADQGGPIEARIEGLIFQANQLKNAGKPEDGLKQAREALALLEKTEDQRVRFLVHSRAGVLYFDISDFENALTEQLKALPIAEQSGKARPRRELLTLTNLGALYLNLRQPEKGLTYIERALPLAEALHATRTQSTLNANLGYALSSLEKYPEANRAYLRSLQLAREIGDLRVQATALVNLSDDALRRKDFTEAANYSEQALALAQTGKLVNVEAISRANLGSALVGQGEFKRGLQQLAAAQLVFQSIGDLATEDAMLTDFVLAAERANEPKQANALLHRQIEIREKLFSESRQRAVSELQERFDASARQKQIDLLERENQLQAAEIDNRRLYSWVVGLVALTVVLLAVVALLSYWRVRDANRRLQIANAQLADQSIRDPLTGLFNRRSFQLAMERRWTERERRHDSDTSVDAFVLLDIDHFKRINDNHGHAAGDVVLVEVAKRLNAGMRDSDMVLRWGGEEFLIYLRGTTLDALRDVVARVLHNLGSTPILHAGQSIAVTASAGFVPLPLAGLPESEFGWERAVQLADMALYLGKVRGRNRAYGVHDLHGPYAELAPAIEHNLAQAIRNRQVSAVEVLGPGATTAADEA